MFKPFISALAVLTLLASCAAPPQAARPQASAGGAATVSSVDTAQANNDDDYETIFVPAPTGSLLGGGSVRVPKRRVASAGGNDETALLGDIRRLNAAAGAPRERPFVVSAVSRVTGVSERELQAQQDLLQMRFGELCAINAIARGNRGKVQEIASQRSKGRSWTDLAKANGLSIVTVVQTTRNASDLTEKTFSNAADREKGGDQKVKSLGVKPQVRPGN